MRSFVLAAVVAALMVAIAAVSVHSNHPEVRVVAPGETEMAYGTAGGLTDPAEYVALEEQRRRDEEAAAAALAAEAQAEAERQAAEAARQRAVPSIVGTGWPHSDLWWMGIAMCEQGGRNDPFFGFFSFMDGSQGGKPWAEQVAAGNALLAWAGREVGPWAASCVAMAYSYAPGG